MHHKPGLPVTVLRNDKATSYLGSAKLGLSSHQAKPINGLTRQ